MSLAGGLKLTDGKFFPLKESVWLHVWCRECSELQSLRRCVRFDFRVVNCVYVCVCMYLCLCVRVQRIIVCLRLSGSSRLLCSAFVITVPRIESSWREVDAGQLDASFQNHFPSKRAQHEDDNTLTTDMELKKYQQIDWLTFICNNMRGRGVTQQHVSKVIVEKSWAMICICFDLCT